MACSAGATPRIGEQREIDGIKYYYVPKQTIYRIPDSDRETVNEIISRCKSQGLSYLCTRVFKTTSFTQSLGVERKFSIFPSEGSKSFIQVFVTGNQWVPSSLLTRREITTI